MADPIIALVAGREVASGREFYEAATQGFGRSDVVRIDFEIRGPRRLALTREISHSEILRTWGRQTARLTNTSEENAVEMYTAAWWHLHTEASRELTAARRREGW